MDISPLPHKPAFQAMRNPVSPTQDRGMNICSSPPSAVPELPRNDPPARRPGLAEYVMLVFVFDNLVLTIIDARDHQTLHVLHC